MTYTCALSRVDSNETLSLVLQKNIELKFNLKK